MKIQINGEIKLQAINKIVTNVIEGTFKKMGKDMGEIRLSQVVFETAFIIESGSEPLKMMAEHNGNFEPFVVMVKVDEYGNIEGEKSNEDVPIYDEIYHKLAKGESIDLPTDAIATEYVDDELEIMDEIIGGDIKGVRYAVKTDNNKQILRYFNNDVLVAEMELTEKEPHKCKCETLCDNCSCI